MVIGVNRIDHQAVSGKNDFHLPRNCHNTRSLAVLVVLNGLGCASISQNTKQDIEYTQLAPKVWMHTSYKELPRIGPYPSNGLLIETEEGVVMVDTAWDEPQTREILKWAQSNLQRPVTTAVVTHAHDDKMGGIEALHEAGVETYAHSLTNADAPSRDLRPARHDLVFEQDVARWADGAIEIVYPGPGHTRGNIVVYLPESKILFGGCLIRPSDAVSLGNTADADVAKWAGTVRGLQARYPEVARVVPTHGPPASAALLQHTVDLAAKAT